jgi:hypothetical protein
MVLLQMIISEPIDIPIIDTIIELEERNREDLLELVKLVYPEYFKSKTATLGNYGIYKDDQLVAVTGERMQMSDFIEVSAVITHPITLERICKTVGSAYCEYYYQSK